MLERSYGARRNSGSKVDVSDHVGSEQTVIEFILRLEVMLVVACFDIKNEHFYRFDSMDSVFLVRHH